MGYCNTYQKTIKHTIKELARENPIQLKNNGRNEMKPVVSKRLTGDKILQMFEEKVELGFKAKPHIFQRDFFSAYLNAVAPDLMGEAEWQRVGRQICLARGWEKVSKFVFVVAPRRFGKSYMLAMIIAVRAWMMCFVLHRDDRQVVFSQGARTSRLLRDYVIANLIELGLAKHMPHSRQEEVMLQERPGDPESTSVRMLFYPQNPQKVSLSHLRQIPLSLLFPIHPSRRPKIGAPIYKAL